MSAPCCWGTKMAFWNYFNTIKTYSAKIVHRVYFSDQWHSPLSQTRSCSSKGSWFPCEGSDVCLIQRSNLHWMLRSVDLFSRLCVSIPSNLPYSWYTIFLPSVDLMLIYAYWRGSSAVATEVAVWQKSQIIWNPYTWPAWNKPNDNKE